MALSEDVLGFLNLLDQWGVSFDLEYFLKMAPARHEDKDAQEVAAKLSAVKNAVLGAYRRAKTQPVRDLKSNPEELLDVVTSTLGDDVLDQHLTMEALKEIPAQVERLRNLRVLQVGAEPSKKVSIYFHQASLCYLYGLYDAVAILSRSVLQFALEEALDARRLGVRSIDGGLGYLKNLVVFARRANVLTDRLLPLAERIRVTGNRASHVNKTQEADARQVMIDTVAVLRHLYAALSGGSDDA